MPETDAMVSLAGSWRARDKAAVDDIRIPPHSVEAEQAVLGGLMLDNRAWDAIADRLVAEDFYRRDHQLIFGAIAESGNKVRSGFLPLKDQLGPLIDRIDLLHQHKGQLPGLTTGFNELDRMTAGLQKGDLIVIAGRPSMGKTTFAINIAENAAFG